MWEPLYCGYIRRWTYSQEIHTEVFRGKEPCCLQPTDKWFRKNNSVHTRACTCAWGETETDTEIEKERGRERE